MLKCGLDIVRWIQSWLNNHSQWVLLNGFTSFWREILSTHTQDSLLCPKSLQWSGERECLSICRWHKPVGESRQVVNILEDWIRIQNYLTGSISGPVPTRWNLMDKICKKLKTLKICNGGNANINVHMGTKKSETQVQDGEKLVWQQHEWKKIQASYLFIYKIPLSLFLFSKWCTTIKKYKKNI